MVIGNTDNGLLNKKHTKRLKLSDAAFELFSTKGFHSTAIDDIVKKAGVAKGTFYLYFNDKYDIMDRIVLAKSSMVIRESLDATLADDHDDFIAGVIYFIDYIIEYFKNNKVLLKIIYKNLSWGLYRKALARPDEYKEMQQIASILIKNLKNNYMSEAELEKTLFMIIELSGSVIYSSIILEEPDTIDNMKPYLFNTIRKMLTQ